MTKQTDPKPQPPAAAIVPKDASVHGDERIDNYFWLRERDNEKVIEYLHAENAYTDAMMQHTTALQEQLFGEIVARIKETDLDVPEKWGEYYYYKRTEAGQQYPIYCRKCGSMEGPEEILLDQNELAAGEDYFELGAFKISPDHNLLAFSTDTSGSETYTLQIKDLETGEILQDQIPNTYYSVQWASDNRTLFYSVLDEAKRPFKLLKHTIGAKASADSEMFTEADDAYFLSLSKSRDGLYLFLQLASKTTTEVWFLHADHPGREFTLIHPRQLEMEYYADHHQGQFYIMTNEDAVNFKLMQVEADNPGKSNWREFIPHRPQTKISGFDLFAKHMAVYERESGLEQIRVLNLDDQSQHHIPFEEPAYSIAPARNPEFNTGLLRFHYSSLVTPDSVYDYDMAGRERTLLKQTKVLGGYDPTQFTTERIFAIAGDGAEIPISLVYKKGLRREGTNPLLLYGYGSYGVTIDPAFASMRLSLLDRGFVFAIAHVRGGGLLGRPWYDAGKLLQKKNTFADFIACAEHLIANKFTSKDKLAIYGGSAGGLLLGTVLNLRPDLFKVAVAKVPFVDVINTMLDASIPLTVTEYEEWGNPNDKTFYDYMRSYSPYDNVAAKDYPDILVTAGLNDPRVQYWEPAKWTAKLRAHKTGDSVLLLKTFMGAGHAGSSGRYERYKDLAFDYAFILDRLGIDRGVR